MIGCLWCWSAKWNKNIWRITTLTLLHSSLVAVEQSVQSGTVVHHEHPSSGTFGGHASFPLDVQCHLNRQPSITVTLLLTRGDSHDHLLVHTETDDRQPHQVKHSRLIYSMWHTWHMMTYRTCVDSWQQLKSDSGRGHDPDDVIPRLTYKRMSRWCFTPVNHFI